jgi:MoaA/NifB/PqqE/SkfB family radical SAM enzyme
MAAYRIIPRRIQLEASSHCQLRCPSCPTTSRAIQPAVGSGFLKLADFKKLLDANPQLQHIELSNYGEIFLNPELLGMLEYAYHRGMALSAGNGANLNRVRPDVLDGIVKYRLRRITCSIDGATAGTYRKYRVRGNFNAVIANIREINRLKAAYGSPYPELVWQYIVFGHNEHEIPDARRLAGELGMGFYLKLSWDNELSPPRDDDALRRELGVASREEFKQRHGVDYMQKICTQLWNSPQINWDGKVLGCCRNFWGDFGANAFTDGLVESVNSEKMQYARDMLTGARPARDDIPCTTCEIYLGMRARGTWFRARPRPGP